MNDGNSSAHCHHHRGQGTRARNRFCLGFHRDFRNFFLNHWIVDYFIEHPEIRRERGKSLFRNPPTMPESQAIVIGPENENLPINLATCRYDFLQIILCLRRFPELEKSKNEYYSCEFEKIHSNEIQTREISSVNTKMS